MEAQADAEGQRLKVTSELQAIEERAKTAAAYTANSRSCVLEELAALRELREKRERAIYLDFPANKIRARTRRSWWDNKGVDQKRGRNYVPDDETSCVPLFFNSMDSVLADVDKAAG